MRFLIHQNSRYQKSANRIKHILETKPFSANEIFLKYTQFVLDNNGELPELKAEAMNMNFITQNNLDIYLLLATFVLLITTFIMFLVIYVFKLLFAKFYWSKTNLKKLE